MTRIDADLRMDLGEEGLRRMMTSYEGARHSVVGLLSSMGRTKFIGSGSQTAEVPIEDQIFEIGSITKVFTAILLCVLVEEGKLDPRAPVAEISDSLSDVPDWITPERLVSHTSGLPNIYVPLWKALFLQQPEGPYARFSRTDLLGWFRDWKGKDPGRKLRHRYSNLGVGLLGEALAIQQKKPFAQLLADKVINPLGLKDTGGALDNHQLARIMQPRNTAGKPVSAWFFDALAGAGFLRSSARDLGCFAQRVIEAVNAPQTNLDRAIKRSVQPIFELAHKGGVAVAAQCSGWIEMKRDASGTRILLANGGTAGSTCALYVCPENETALALVSNNGVAANLWASAKLSWSNQTRQAQDILMAS